MIRREKLIRIKIQHFLRPYLLFGILFLLREQHYADGSSDTDSNHKVLDRESQEDTAVRHFHDRGNKILSTLL